jgi:hypothetical protein
MQIEDKLIILIISLIFAGLLTIFLLKCGENKTAEPNLQTMVNASENITTMTKSLYVKPGYFKSMGEVSARVQSPFLKSFSEIKIWVSTNQVDWKEVIGENYTRLGYINLNNPNHLLYFKFYLPTGQSLYLKNITKNELLQSFKGDIKVKGISTGRDKVLLILIFIALLGTIYTILITQLEDIDLYENLKKFFATIYSILLCWRS